MLSFFYCRVKGLPTRKKYKFRVLAENLAGTGKPSKETDQILVKDPIGKTAAELYLINTRWAIQ